MENWTNMERLWQRCIYDYLRAEPEDHYVLLVSLCVAESLVVLGPSPSVCEQAAVCVCLAVWVFVLCPDGATAEHAGAYIAASLP